MSSSKIFGKSSSGFTGILVLLLVICLVECATGSCLSYGHSCWGAHGKRSGKSPSSAPDWYLTRILRRMAADSELNHVRQEVGNDDVGDIFRLTVADNVPTVNGLMFSKEESPIGLRSRIPEAKPMLDDNLLANMKIWQLMRQASEEK
ncbi:unnamed protein product, partial [Iphiclides podalirius]